MTARQPVVIAHRGASGYLPEHTLAAKALAHAMGADFLEQDVVLTSDSVPIVLHDIHLDSTTDVAQKFPGRQREDGHFYAVDFKLAEVKALAVHERVRIARGKRKAVYPQRFPPEHSFFSVPTLAEEIDLINGLDRSRGRRTGLYIELKSPNRHHEQGLDLPGAVLGLLTEKGLGREPGRVILQCFDDATLRNMQDALKHSFEQPPAIIQLIADKNWGEDSAVDYDFLRTEKGLDYIASYAQGIGPWISHIYLGRKADGSPELSSLVAQAHARGLLVHPFTFRRDDLPAGMETFNDLLSLFIDDLEVDGLFTDFPDLAVQFLRGKGSGQ